MVLLDKLALEREAINPADTEKIAESLAKS